MAINIINIYLLIISIIYYLLFIIYYLLFIVCDDGDYTNPKNRYRDSNEYNKYQQKDQRHKKK